MDLLNILAIIGIVVGTSTMVSMIYDTRRQNAYDKQLAKNIEMMRYHFWLKTIGLNETAYMFNEVGIRVSLGEEV